MKMIFNKTALPFMLLTCLFFAGAANGQSHKRPGLLVLSHGSSSAKVNNKVEAMVEKMRKENKKTSTFHAIENAFLEVGAPTAKTGVERLQSAGCDMIVVVPFFTSQDGHTQDDIPVVMGLSFDSKVIAELKEEGIALAEPKVPVEITATLNQSGLIAAFLASEAKSLSKDPVQEGFIAISLEKNDYANIVTPAIAAATKKAAADEGIKNYKDVYSWQDESFWQNVMPTVKYFSKNNKRVLITSVYTTRSAKSLYTNATIAAEAKGINTKEGLGEGKLVFSNKSLIDFKGTPGAVLELAAKKLNK